MCIRDRINTERKERKIAKIKSEHKKEGKGWVDRQTENGRTIVIKRSQDHGRSCESQGSLKSDRVLPYIHKEKPYF